MKNHCEIIKRGQTMIYKCGHDHNGCDFSPCEYFWTNNDRTACKFREQGRWLSDDIPRCNCKDAQSAIDKVKEK